MKKKKNTRPLYQMPIRTTTKSSTHTHKNTVPALLAHVNRASNTTQTPEQSQQEDNTTNKAENVSA